VHLLVLAKQACKRRVIPGDERVLCRLPDRRLLREAGASGYLVGELLPGVEAVIACDRVLGIGQLPRRLGIRRFPAFEKFFRLFPVLLEVWTGG
jgi:hypothetical protein